ncbi:HAD hydrolase-like protein [Actinospica durhamensis]|uniref:HAD hydrolase-like protein n=1 Tax=Actinospica durhamensis TaxID=1508375 RepID=A0A941EMJ1_9ACTN|nr:HAD family hydrolase [Actinospica durhamensis]MBR7834046.1 HAD hydrolase-like protein [Actinospica durhamensis]
MSTTPIRLACLDMAGTTVADDGLVLAAFSAALDELKVAEPAERERMTRYVVDTMGESKITVFRALFPGDEQAAQEGNAAFESAYGERVELTRALPGAEQAFAALRSEGIAVALTTGFSRTTADALLEHLGWRPLIDLSVTPGEVGGRGRPHPDMILAAAARLADDETRAVAVLGDTASDIRSGLAAGAPIVAGVLTGAHDRATLTAAGATRVLDHVAEFPALLREQARPLHP